MDLMLFATRLRPFNQAFGGTDVEYCLLEQGLPLSVVHGRHVGTHLVPST